MSKEFYLSQPPAVEVHPVKSGTDIILRKNIVETTQEPLEESGEATTMYECDEMQYRYCGSLTAEEIEADFDTWWNYTPPSPIADTETIEQQITDLQLALCEVYELLL